MKVFTSVEVILSPSSIFILLSLALSLPCKLPLYSFCGLSPYVQNIAQRFPRYLCLQFGRYLVRKDATKLQCIIYLKCERSGRVILFWSFFRVWNICIENSHTFHKSCESSIKIDDIFCKRKFILSYRYYW